MTTGLQSFIARFQYFDQASIGINFPYEILWIFMISGLQSFIARFQYFYQASIAINFPYEIIWICMISGLQGFIARFQYFDQASIAINFLYEMLWILCDFGIQSSRATPKWYYKKKRWPKATSKKDESSIRWQEKNRTTTRSHTQVSLKKEVAEGHFQERQE